jgi:hypothetical protein
MKTAIFIYEASQIEEIPTLNKGVGEYNLFAVGADIEFLLEEKGIPFVSVRDHRTISTPERLMFARKVGENLMYDEAFSFFVYRGVSLARLYRAALQYYLPKLSYYLDIVSSILKSEYSHVRIFAPEYMPGPTAAVLEGFNTNALSDALRLVAEKNQLNLEVLEPKRKTTKQHAFDIKKLLSTPALAVFNAMVRICVPKKKIRILASELWKNTEPLFGELAEAELLLFDRAEAKNMGFRSILQTRAQFLHPEEFISTSGWKHIREAHKKFELSWENFLANKKDILNIEYLGYNLAPILTRVLERVLSAGAERTLKEIEGTFSAIDTLRPHLVLVRAGISAQTHFGVLCEVARIKKIPSLELQHGILSVFEGDFTYDPSSQYIAEYGPLVREQLTAHHFAPRSTFLDVGSPRFDEYMKLKDEPSSERGVHVLHIGPQLTPGEWNDSYDVVDYFDSTARALRSLSDVRVTVKLRANRAGEKFFREAIRRTYGDRVVRVAMFEPLQTLIKEADVVVSCHSTSYLEALIAGKPVIIDGIQPIYKALARADLAPFKDQGALVVAETNEELQSSLHSLIGSPDERNSLGIEGEEFVRKNFFLDGNSSRRLAGEIRKLVEGTSR